MAAGIHSEKGEAEPGGPSRIAVAVPSYNHARFVAGALRSMFRQTLAPARLLVIDDGSSDESTGVIERTLRECPFPCDFIARKNRGLCATLNEAFSRTSGDYFAYLGSDDSWEPHFLETTASLLAANPDAVAAYGHAYILDGRGERVGCTATMGRYRGGDMRLALLAGQSVPKSPTVMYRRSALERFSWNEQSRLEDYEMYLRLSGAGPFAFTPKAVGSWRLHDNNVSSDIAFMLERALDAHDRIGPTLAVTTDELERTRAALIFRAAGYYLDAGDRRTAFEYTRKGLRGATDLPALLKRLVKLVTPRLVWEVRAAALRARAGQDQPPE